MVDKKKGGFEIDLGGGNNGNTNVDLSTPPAISAADLEDMLNKLRHQKPPTPGLDEMNPRIDFGGEGKPPVGGKIDLLPFVPDGPVKMEPLPFITTGSEKPHFVPLPYETAVPITGITGGDYNLEPGERYIAREKQAQEVRDELNNVSVHGKDAFTARGTDVVSSRPVSEDVKETINNMTPEEKQRAFGKAEVSIDSENHLVIANADKLGKSGVERLEVAAGLAVGGNVAELDSLAKTGTYKKSDGMLSELPIINGDITQNNSSHDIMDVKKNDPAFKAAENKAKAYVKEHGGNIDNTEMGQLAMEVTHKNHADIKAIAAVMMANGAFVERGQGYLGGDHTNPNFGDKVTIGEATTNTKHHDHDTTLALAKLILQEAKPHHVPPGARVDPGTTVSNAATHSYDVADKGLKGLG